MAGEVRGADDRGPVGPPQSRPGSGSLADRRMARLLERLRAKGGSPGVICADNGPEFTGKALDRRAQAAGVKRSSSGPASRQTTAMWRASTAASARSAWTPKCSPPWKGPEKSLRHGGGTTTPPDCIAPLAASALKSTEQPGVGKTNQARGRTLGWYTRWLG